MWLKNELKHKKGKSNTPYTGWMKNRVDSDYGKMIYAHRMSTVEPVFANIGINKGLDRFSLRGKAKVQRQWQLCCTVHNIEKIMNYGEMHREWAETRCMSDTNAGIHKQGI